MSKQMLKNVEIQKVKNQNVYMEIEILNMKTEMLKFTIIMLITDNRRVVNIIVEILCVWCFKLA